jgi:maltose O-acetyltransferase
VKDLPSNSVCVGSPAKPIRYLQEDESNPRGECK